MFKKIVDRYKEKRKQREEMSLSELEKVIKKRKYGFIILYCGFILFVYLGIVLTIETVLGLLFLSIMFGVLTVIAFIDYIFTRLLHYFKLNER